MEQKQIDLVQSGFQKVMRQRDLFAIDFYNELFRIAPHLRQIFPKDMARQRKKLSESLIIIMQYLGNSEAEMRDYLFHLGQKHAQEYQTLPEHYPVLKEALMTTLTYQLGELWTREMKEAWSVTIDKIAVYMMLPV